jgi:uncharacterized membrane protein YkoI
MKPTRKQLAAVAAVAVLGTGGAAIAGASGDDEGPGDDAGEARQQIDDASDSRRAEQAALEAVGEGRVTEVERADEGTSGYEVELRLPDGTYREVALDERFQVTSVELDSN